MSENRLIPIVRIQNVVSGSDSKISFEGDFNESDRIIQAEFEIIFQDSHLTEEITISIRRTSRALSSMIDFSGLGFSINVLDMSISDGSIRILIVTVIIASFNVVANYDSLKKNLPSVIEDVSNVASMIIHAASVGAPKEGTSSPFKAPIMPVGPSVNPPPKRKSIRFDP